MTRVVCFTSPKPIKICLAGPLTHSTHPSPTLPPGQAANSCISSHASCVGYLFGFSLPHSCPSSWPNWVWCCLRNGILHIRGALTMGSGRCGLSLQAPGIGSLTSIYNLDFHCLWWLSFSFNMEFSFVSMIPSWRSSNF